MGLVVVPLGVGICKVPKLRVFVLRDAAGEHAVGVERREEVLASVETELMSSSEGNQMSNGELAAVGDSPVVLVLPR